MFSKNHIVLLMLAIAMLSIIVTSACASEPEIVEVIKEPDRANRLVGHLKVVNPLIPVSGNLIG